MLRQLQLTILLLLCGAPAVSQVPEVEELPEIRRYTVEVVIFRYAQEVATGSEIFVPEEVMLEEIDLASLPSPGEPPLITRPAETTFEEEMLEEKTLILERDVVILDEEDYTMVEIVEMLERLEVYEPLIHLGWSQSTWPDQEREPMLLSAFGVPPEGLDGELTLYLSRYLHLVVDLELDEQREDDTLYNEPEISYGDYRTLSEIRDPARPEPVRYRIEENRIFRSGELRYFDHPKFGVLAKVTRLEDEEPTDAEIESELLGYPPE